MNTLNYYLIMLGADIDANDFTEAGDKLKNLISAIIPWAIGALVIAVIVWGVSIGLKFASAKRQEQRVEAKEYLKQFLIGILVIFIVVALASTVVGALANWAGYTPQNIMPTGN